MQVNVGELTITLFYFLIFRVNIYIIGLISISRVFEQIQPPTRVLKCSKTTIQAYSKLHQVVDTTRWNWRFLFWKFLPFLGRGNCSCNTFNRAWCSCRLKFIAFSFLFIHVLHNSWGFSVTQKYQVSRTHTFKHLKTKNIKKIERLEKY
jgi:hypothetical protein